MITKFLLIVLIILIIKSIIAEFFPNFNKSSLNSEQRNQDNSNNDPIEVDYEEVE